ncbi:UDP-N-acetylmuramoyl-L-alanine--D-glutamate ligase [Patescibacteria group bacterium]|nr:UDP-N-acetylmuramoyl-L-alanine--D-glutamate ligase [Patescibacteria group bacterium]
MKNLFKNKRVTIMGLGLHGGGAGVAKFFYEQGAEVLVTDLKTKEQLEKSLKKLRKFNIKYRLGEHKEEDFINTDLIIKNPAVPQSSRYLEIARNNKVSITTDINIFFELSRAFAIGVTGTKGKSTTATLIYEILKSKSRNTILAGNIGVSPLEFLDKINEKSKVVLELSNFELEDLKKSPQIAVITAIYPDHLDRYGSYEEYIESKKPIFKYQKPTDFLILNYDNPQVRNFEKDANSNIYFFSNNFYLKRDKKNPGCFIEDNNVFFANETEPIFNIEEIKLPGEHNISNILGAVTVAKILKIPNKNIKKVVSKFGGVSNRQQVIAQINGVKYINDTTATMPEAVIQALKTIKGEDSQSRIILIAGGQDKKLEYKELAKEIIGKVEKLVLLPGTASEKIKRELFNIKPNFKVISVESMVGAVKEASLGIQNKDIILLSPAAASFTPLGVIKRKTKKEDKALKPLTGFNLFKNEFDRGEQFIKAVKKLK